MKRKILSAVPLKELGQKLTAEKVLPPALVAVFSFITASGRIAGGAYPFALSLTAAVHGFPLAAASAAGGMLGSLRIGGGGSYFAVIFALFIARAVLTHWLSNDSGGGLLRRGIGSKGGKKNSGAAVSEVSAASMAVESGKILPTKGSVGASAASISGGREILGRFLDAARVYVRECAAISCRESLPVRMALGAVGMMLSGLFYSRSFGYSYVFLIGTVVASALTPVLVWLYASAGRRNGESESLTADAGMIALAASAVLSLRGTGSVMFDFGVALAFAATLFASRFRGMFVGCLYGVVCGAVLTPSYALLYAIAGVTSGLLWRVSEVLAVTVSCAAGIFWSIYSSGIGAMSALVPELIVTSAVLAPLCISGILPPPAAGYGDIFTSACGRGRRALPLSLRREGGRADAHEYDSAMLAVRAEDRGKRIEALSDSMTELSKAIRDASDRLATPDDGELDEICAVSFEKYCSRCGLRCACYEKDGGVMFDVRERMAAGLREDGHASAAAVPSFLAKRCYNMGSIIDDISALFSKKRAEAKLYDRTEVVASDYEAMADMLRESAVHDSGEYRADIKLTEALRHHIMSSAAARGAFRTAEVTVFGERVKRIVARGVNVGSGTPGADEILALFSEGVGFSLTPPEFELNGRDVIMKMRCREELEVRCGRASVAMSELGGQFVPCKGEENFAARVFEKGGGHGFGKTARENSGDVISSFQTEDGRFFMLICDGMGTGREASLTAGICVMFLEKLLTAGASMEMSLKMLNSMMRVRKSECSATVDLMEIDLMNGHTRFVKSGAAPSFVLRDGRLFRLQSKTVPIGIVRALDAEMIRFDICRGDTVVMLSDGVVRSFEDCPWLYDMLCDPGVLGGDPGEAARRIIGGAVKNGAKDDVTAGVVKIF